VQWYEEEVRALELACAARANGHRPPVFYGSSSVRLWDSLAVDFDPNVLNLGFGGSTMEACDYFFARLVPPVNPRSLLLYAGDNDLGDGRAVEQILDSFRSLAARVRASLGAVPFGFVSVKPSPARYPIIDRIRRLNGLIRREIESDPAAYYVDIFHPMLQPDGAPCRSYFLEDGLHLSREGYLLWSRVLEPYRNRICTP
jgi:lysophospholipase L1-like esterase